MHLPVLFPLNKTAKMAGSIHAFDRHGYALSSDGFRVQRAETTGPNAILYQDYAPGLQSLKNRHTGINPLGSCCMAPGIN